MVIFSPTQRSSLHLWVWVPGPFGGQFLQCCCYRRSLQLRWCCRLRWLPLRKTTLHSGSWSHGDVKMCKCIFIYMYIYIYIYIYVQYIYTHLSTYACMASALFQKFWSSNTCWKMIERIEQKWRVVFWAPCFAILTCYLCKRYQTFFSNKTLLLL